MIIKKSQYCFTKINYTIIFSNSSFLILVKFEGIYLFFKLVSPSKFFVSILQTPFSSLEYNIKISHGMGSSSYTF